MDILDEINKLKKEIGQKLTGIKDLPTDIDVLKKIKSLLDGRKDDDKEDKKKEPPTKKLSVIERRRLRKAEKKK